ncbi:MAG: type II toxin-antitoxin system RelE/ParE family toxin [Leptospira sp.]|nr:type II toxin-antitoxin system RelE/ParE family toxin [Leptospira sp.]
MEIKEKFGGILIQDVKDPNHGFSIVATTTSQGSSPFFEYFAELSKTAKSIEGSILKSRDVESINYATLKYYFERMSKTGAWNNPKQIKKLEGDLFEFKVQTGLRVIFAYDPVNRKVVLITHSFLKKKQKTPKKEIERSKELLKNFLDERC